MMSDELKKWLIKNYMMYGKVIDFSISDGGYSMKLWGEGYTSSSCHVWYEYSRDEYLTHVNMNIWRFTQKFFDEVMNDSL